MCAAIVACLALAPSAHAAFGFTGLAAAPTNPAAGANSDVAIHIGFKSPSDDVKDLTVALPPGLVGNPRATPLCTLAQLQGDSCPSASQVGTVTTSANAHLLDPLPLTLPLTVNGSLYNVEPAAGQPARFGIVLRPTGSDPLPLLEKIIQVSDVKLRKGDFGLNTVLTDIPNVAHAAGQALTVPIDITAIDIQLSGTVGGNGFMRNPTSCGMKTTRFIADSHTNPNKLVVGNASFTSTNCASLPFSPTFRAWVGSAGRTSAGTKPPLTTQITQDAGEAGLNSARVLLPFSLTPNFDVLSGALCSEAQFRSNAAACPANSIVGSAQATSPFLSAAEAGSVVVVPPSRGDQLPRLGVDLHGPLTLQLMGQFVAPAAGIGQTFDGLPDIPISKFVLRFKAGGLVVAAQDLCKPPKLPFKLNFGGWNGAAVNASVVPTVQGCGNGG
ncbi:MAG TPA: hypothetical protein VN458_07510 [Solirubrobacterales bacterium]|nr:hypothetical protein [Solirubrobacterales bacterium]